MSPYPSIVASYYPAYAARDFMFVLTSSRGHATCMWYWVKSPDGEQSDYNVDELRLALQEGRLQPDWMGRRYDEKDWFPVQHLLAQDDEATEPLAPPPAPQFALACCKCSKPLRIELPIEEVTYTCPECKTHYKSTKVSDTPLTYVLMPESCGNN